MKKRKSFEAAILDSYAKGRLRSAAPSRAELKRYRAVAGRFVEKPARATGRGRKRRARAA